MHACRSARKMNVLVSLLLWPFIVYHSINLPGGDAVRFANGFPSRLVYRMLPFPMDRAIVLIPEMNFTCNGSIVGYTVAGPIMGNPQIQVWRETSSSQSGVRYERIDSRQIIDDRLCTGLTLKCHGSLQLMDRISVRFGDILGFKLPRNSKLMVATATQAPTNYVFEEGISRGPVSLTDSISSPKLLPQITLEIESRGSQSKDCTRGFPDNPLVSEINNYNIMRSSTVTLLIPAMNFTCNATIAGFAVAGTRVPRSQLQIWRKNSSQTDFVYYKAGNIAGEFCAYQRRIVNITYWCTLFEVSRLSVQSGDILGLQLPNQILFILNGSGGPVNYIHERAYQLNSTITISHNENNSIANQLPQIIFIKSLLKWISRQNSY